MTIYDISESIPYSLSLPSSEVTFDLTNIAYDLVIDNLPFILKINNQDPYRRETAPYKKEQFDSSQEPGEQSLTGWWLRSQTSWHNGAGLKFYEPGLDYQNVNNRFNDSRGIDIWTVGEIKLLPEVVKVYTGNTLINATAGSDGTDVLVSGDSVGALKKILFSADVTQTPVPYTIASHTAYPFSSVTTDGTNYYATCPRAIHTGPIGSDSDALAFKFSDTDVTDTFVKYVKGYVLFGLTRSIYNMSIIPSGAGRTTSVNTHATTTVADILSTDFKTHINPDWKWNDATAGPAAIYMSGNAGNNGEVWQVLFDEATNTIDMPGATMVLSLPDGETVKTIHYYLGVLALGTTKGIRICPINANNQVVLGPLLFDTDFSIKGFTSSDNYIYAATKVYNDAATFTQACVVRVDLSSLFDDGTYPYAYDLQYRSTVTSEATEAHQVGGRIVMVVEEDNATDTGQLHIESATLKRDTGWLKTGKIRYGTIEPKFFRYLNVQCTTGVGDTIVVSTINRYDVEESLTALSEGLSNQDVLLSTLSAKQEHIALKFTFNNVTADQELPVLEAYQLKTLPASRRQRLYQYPLSCYDHQMDRYSSVFGYTGRAIEYIQLLEAIEETGKFITVKDYRTNEEYQGVIEEVRFTNESSPDKNNSGFGGLLLVTVRKL